MATTAIERVMLYGGSRSGKTFVGVYAVVTRALMAPDSRHAIIRHRFNAVKTSVGLETVPAVMRIAYPSVPYTIDKTDWVVRLPNGAEIWLLGLDDKNRVEKILGKEYATLYFNECSQLSWASVEVALTRLAQGCRKSDGRDLKLLAIFDCNPPGKAHWTYRHFALKQSPSAKTPYAFPDSLAWLQMNPDDNRENLPDSYFRTLEGLSGAARKRFLRGEFSDDMDGALWTPDSIERGRLEDAPPLSRIVVAVDPSGAAGAEDFRSDEIGIVVAGLLVERKDGKPQVAVLEDATLRGSPAEWSAMAARCYRQWKADAIVGEANFGGAMVEAIIKDACKEARYIAVKASRGKHVRAEPVAALAEEGRAYFVGQFAGLEDQLCGFLASGYIGDRSPDRADAYIWAASELIGNDSPYAARLHAAL